MTVETTTIAVRRVIVTLKWVNPKSREREALETVRRTDMQKMAAWHLKGISGPSRLSAYPLVRKAASNTCRCSLMSSFQAIRREDNCPCSFLLTAQKMLESDDLHEGVPQTLDRPEKISAPECLGSSSRILSAQAVMLSGTEERRTHLNRPYYYCMAHTICDEPECI